MNQNIQIATMAFNNLSVQERQALLREWTDQPKPVEPDRLLRPRTAAARLGVTPRTIFSLMRTGALTRIRLPGRKLGCGVQNSELEKLIRGEA